MNNLPLPEEYCQEDSIFHQYGLYRKLDNGKLEVIDLCNPLFKDMLSINGTELEQILKETLPKQEAKSIIKTIRSIK